MFQFINIMVPLFCFLISLNNALFLNFHLQVFEKLVLDILLDIIISKLCESQGPNVHY